MRRGDLTATEWRDVKELLATARSRRGRPPENTRAVINGILWRLRTGAPWRDVPGRYGDWNKIYRRFCRWCQSGIWASVATALGDGTAVPQPERGNGRINRRPMAATNARSVFAKRPAGAGFSAVVRPGARVAAGLASTRRSTRPATR
ncbi:MAG: transposase [Dongiaceae bacterium]